MTTTDRVALDVVRSLVRVRRWERVALAATVALAGGCGDDAATMPDAATIDTMPDIDASACATGTFPMSLTFRQDAFTGPALAGVHGCVITHPEIPCGDTGIDGSWSFCAPENSEIAISAEKPNYMPIIVSRVTSTSQPSDIRARILTLNAPNCVIWGSAGASCPPSTSDPGGLLHIGVRENMPGVDAGLTSPPGYPAPIGDAVVTLEPAPLLGPFYPVNGMVDPTLTATHPSNGNALAADVTEGNQQIVRITKTGQTCHAFAYDAWPAGDGAIRVPILRGFRSFAAVTCE